eukprot:SAG31_NODE_21_length_34109_cov_60.598824_32_plen_79_part_00
MAVETGQKATALRAEVQRLKAETLDLEQCALAAKNQAVELRRTAVEEEENVQHRKKNAADAAATAVRPILCSLLTSAF